MKSSRVVYMDPQSVVSQEILHAIHSAPIFSGLGLIEQKMLADKSVISRCAPDTILIEQGGIGDTLYILMEGRMQVSIKDLTMGWKRINTLGPGEVVGEIAIIKRVPRTARVSALTPCKYLSLQAGEFFQVYRYFPARARDNIQLVIAKRLQELNSRRRF